MRSGDVVLDWEVTYQGVAVTVRATSGRGFTSASADDPADAEYIDCIGSLGSWEQAVGTAGDPDATGTAGHGHIVLLRDRGDLAWLTDAVVAGGRVRLRRIGADRLISTAVVDLDAECGGVEITEDEVVIVLRDQRARLADRRLVEDEYVGDNVGEVGLEGEESLEAQTKPWLAGVVRHVGPPRCNAAALTYQLSVAAEQALVCDAVHEGGVAITAEADYPDLATLQSTAPSAYHYRMYPGAPTEGAYLKLGSAPVLSVTVDVTEGASAADRTAGALLARVAVRAGQDAAAIDDRTAGAPWTAGVWIGAGANARAGTWLDLLARSVHGWWGYDRLGRLCIGLLRAPTEPVVATLTDDDIVTDGLDARLTRTDEAGQPVWRVTVLGRRHWTILAREGIAGAVTDQADIDRWRQA